MDLEKGMLKAADAADKMKNGSILETIVTITSILFYEKRGNLITVKDASVHNNPEGKAEGIIRLMEFADLGFIRILLHGKGRIIGI